MYAILFLHNYTNSNNGYCYTLMISFLFSLFYFFSYFLLLTFLSDSLTALFFFLRPKLMSDCSCCLHSLCANTKIMRGTGMSEDPKSLMSTQMLSFKLHSISHLSSELCECVMAMLQGS